MMEIPAVHFFARLTISTKSKSLLAIVVTIGNCGHLQAQPVAENPIEEVIVTAQKREQNIQNIGITMSAVGSAEMKQRALQTLPEITSSISNVQLFEDYGGHGLPTWVIRGVGLQDFNANNTSTAAVYVDEVYQVSSVMGGVGLFDAERVEVLKGPQGGFYGRNTSGGAVNLRTRRPTLGNANGYANATYSSWETWNMEAASNLTLGDNAALRVAGNRQFSGDAWQTSLVNNKPWGEKDLWNARSWLLFDPSDDMRIQWKVYGGENNSELNLGRAIGLYSAENNLCAAVLSGIRDDDSCYTQAGVAALMAGQTPVMPAVQQRDGATSLSQPLNQLDNDYAGSTLIVDYDFDDLRLTSITNFETFNYGASFDFDGTPLELGHNFSQSDIKVWSQEFRLASQPSTPLSWMLGAYVSGEEFAENRDFLLGDSLKANFQVGRLSYDQDTESLAVYGNIGYQLSSTLKFNATARYTGEEKTYRNGTILLPAFPPPYDVLASGLRSDYKLHSNWSGNVGLDWQVADALLVYGTVSRGFKAGGFYGGFPLEPGDTNPYKEETVIAYEAGFKSQLGDSLILNGATFFYDYRDVQGYIVQFSDVTETSIELLSNQGDAEHRGAELELQWSLTDNFSVSASGGYLDARMADSKTFTRNLLGESVPVRGQRPYSPRWSATAGFQYQQLLANAVRLNAGLDYNYRTDFAGSLSSPADNAVYGLNGYGLFNGSVFFTSDEWTLGVWGKNLADKTYVPRVVFDSFGDFIDIPGEPRSWGVKLEKNW
jgi:iron complex outermembrane receptor protein